VNPLGDDHNPSVAHDGRLDCLAVCRSLDCPLPNLPENKTMPKRPVAKLRTRSTLESRHRKLTRRDVRAAAKRLKNWGRWGRNDELGTLNFVSAENIVEAARLVRRGKVFSLALNYDSKGPQGGKSKYPSLGRFNPVHVMLRTGTDAYSGVLDHRKIRGADDLVIMPLQCGTQWDGLGHIFYEDHMWNGYDCRTVTTSGAQKAGIEKTKDRMVGRGVLLDIPALFGRKWLPDGFAITNAMLEAAEAKERVNVKRGDYLIVRTGHVEAKLASKTWDGYSGGDAPGLAFETLDWLHAREVAAVVTDTWGVEVRPNETEDTNQPWHWIAIPIMGLSVGEIFYLADLAKDCRKDGRYEFMFVAPALPITGAVGSPVNPLAIK
jgi:kynurenine formamidase